MKRLESLVKEAPEIQLPSIDWNKATVKIYPMKDDVMAMLVGGFFAREDDLTIGGKGGAAAVFKYSEISELETTTRNIQFIYARNNKVRIDKIS